MKKQRKWSVNEDKYLTDNYGKLPTKQIGEDLDRTYQSVKSRATKVLKIPHGGLCKNNLKVLFDDTNFNWYWIGFIAGDGHLNNKYLTITLDNKDEEHLEILAKHLNVKVFRNKKNYSVLSCSDFCNIETLRDKMGGTDDPKTYNPLNIDYDISQDNMWSFIFGFLDADGCIETKGSTAKQLKIEVHGSWYDNLSKLSSFIKEESNVKSNVSITKRGYALFRITGHDNIATIRTKLYDLKIPFLQRKWNTFETTTSGTNFFNNIKDEVVKLYKAGENLHSISKKLGVKYGSLYNHKKELDNLIKK